MNGQKWPWYASKLKELGDICPLTSYIEIISLVSKALKQYKKVTSQALEARV